MHNFLYSTLKIKLCYYSLLLGGFKIISQLILGKIHFQYFSVFDIKNYSDLFNTRTYTLMKT